MSLRLAIQFEAISSKPTTPGSPDLKFERLHSIGGTAARKMIEAERGGWKRHAEPRRGGEARVRSAHVLADGSQAIRPQGRQKAKMSHHSTNSEALLGKPSTTKGDFALLPGSGQRARQDSGAEAVATRAPHYEDEAGYETKEERGTEEGGSCISCHASSCDPQRIKALGHEDMSPQQVRHEERQTGHKGHLAFTRSADQADPAVGVSISRQRRKGGGRPWTPNVGYLNA